MNNNYKNSTVLCKISDKLTAFWKKSYLSSVFCYGDGEKVETSLIIGTFKKIPFKKYVSSPIKSFVSKSFDNSYLLGKIHLFFEYLLSVSLKCYGWCVLTFVLVSLLFNVLNHSFTETIALNSAVAGISIIPVLLVSKSVSSVICDSGLASLLMLKFLNCEKLLFYSKNKSKGSISGSIIVGFVASFFTLAYSRKEIVVFIALLILTAVFMCHPETSVLTISLVVAFIPYKITIYLVAVAIISYVVKVLRGKRSAYLNVYDILPLGFIAFYLFFFNGKGNSFVAVLMPLLYFLFSGILRNDDLILKSLKNLSLSVTLFAVYNIVLYLIQNHFKNHSAVSELFSVKNSSLYYSESISIFYVCAIIIYIGMMFLGTEKKRISFLGSLVNIIALCLSGESFLFIACILSIGFMFLCVSKNKIVVLFASSALTCLVIKILSMYNQIQSGFGRSFSLLYEYKNYLLLGINNSELIYTTEKVSDAGNLWLQLAFWGGIVFAVYIFITSVAFVRNGISRNDNTPHRVETLSIIVSSVALAYIIASFGCFSWGDYRVYGLFWVLGGFSSALRRYAMKERKILELERSEKP